MATPRDPERYFDRRTIKRHLKRGVVAEGEYERYVTGLPDVSDKIKPRDEGGDDDGFDGRGARGQKSSSAPQIRATMPEPRPDDDYDDDYDDDDDDDDDGDRDSGGSDSGGSDSGGSSDSGGDGPA
ncbi:MAG: hypothetical protein R6X02_33160 [Enhygromyxa sp.]